MIVDVSNQIFSELCTLLDGMATISRPNQDNPLEYPYVTFDDFDNGDIAESKGTSGVKYTSIGFEMQIYTKGDTRMTDAKELRLLIDNKLSGEYGFLRTTSQKIPNLRDDSIYRYVIRYEGIVDENEKIYN
jgi:hypothetical protein